MLHRLPYRALRRSGWALVAAGVALAGVSLAACAATQTPVGPRIGVQDAWVRAARPDAAPASTGMSGGHGMPVAGASGVSAAYMTVSNTGAATDYLVAVTSGVATSAELHETVREGDLVRMRPVARVEMEAGSTVELKPGGLHIMLMGLKRPLTAGEAVQLTLHLERSGDLTVGAVVR